MNNFYIFPGMSFGAVQCDAQTIPERLFMKVRDGRPLLIARRLHADSTPPYEGERRRVDHTEPFMGVYIEGRLSKALHEETIALDPRCLALSFRHIPLSSHASL